MFAREMPLIHFLVCLTVVSRVFFYFLSVWDQHWQGLVCKEKAGGQTEEAREEDGQAEAEGEAVMCGVVLSYLFSSGLSPIFSF